MSFSAVTASLLLAAAVVGTNTVQAQEPAGKSATKDIPEYGPANGTLVIVGGGALGGTGIREKFVSLAGGTDAPIVVVPTPGGNRNAKGELIAYHEEEVLASWKKELGLTNVRMLHTPDPKVADTEEFVKPLREAK